MIVLEFNELSPILMETFIDQGYLPNFKKLRDSSQVLTTDAEEVAPTLDPWIQWVTAHSGLSFEEHGIHHLGDGHKLTVKSLWDHISDAGKSVWVCGSMNIKYHSPINGAVVPDPWTVGVAPYPPKLNDYYLFVQRNVQEYTNDKVPLTRAEIVRFMKFMVANGLSAKTVTAIVKQLAGEKVSGKGRWKRATILDKLQRDVFLHHLKTKRPAFSTFFLNSTAHFQHVHWRNMDPAPFKLKPTDNEQAEYQYAVRYGYEEMDKLVGDVFAAAPANAVIVLATALSQQPCLLYEDVGGKTFYRPRIGEKLVEWLGISNAKAIEPVMSEQFHIRFDNDALAREAAGKLAALKINGKSMMAAEVRDGNVFTGCTIHELLPNDAQITGGPNGASIGFYRLFYQVESLKSGMHHPDGILWIRLPGVPHKVFADKVSLRDFAPTILAMFGIEKPDYMGGRVLPVARTAVRS
jgi:hypothetical protein